MKIILEKDRSKNIIEIVAKDPDDDWFLSVNTLEKKSRKINHTSIIIKKDLENWLRYLKSQGWVINHHS